MFLKTGCEAVDGVHLAQDRVQWTQSIIITTTNCGVNLKPTLWTN